MIKVDPNYKMKREKSVAKPPTAKPINQFGSVIHNFFYKHTFFWLSLGVLKKFLNSGSNVLRYVLIQISILY